MALSFAQRCGSSTTEVASYFPLALSHEWVYVDSVWQQGQLTDVFMDTVRVVKQGAFEKLPTYILSDGRELMWRNDTLFQIVFQRGGYRLPTVYFVAGAPKSVFNYAFGGDVVIQRTSELLDSCPGRFGQKGSSCYRISDACGGDMILQKAIGPVYWRLGHCFAEEGSVLTKTLVHFQPARQSK
ncbi:MAG: hypothetical protein NZL95_05625 [Chitinophagales bacterium]|nr:hypothetical protein [Chitinophagales bacterium]MDW8428013.1 hypothetical protein [Chitinophagales bacterium]